MDGGGWASFIVGWGVCGGRWRYILSGWGGGTFWVGEGVWMFFMSGWRYVLDEW